MLNLEISLKMYIFVKKPINKWKKLNMRLSMMIC